MSPQSLLSSAGLPLYPWCLSSDSFCSWGNAQEQMMMTSPTVLSSTTLNRILSASVHHWRNKYRSWNLKIIQNLTTFVAHLAAGRYNWPADPGSCSSEVRPRCDGGDVSCRSTCPDQHEASEHGPEVYQSDTNTLWPGHTGTDKDEDD